MHKILKQQIRPILTKDGSEFQTLRDKGHGSDEEKTPRCIDERKLWLQISIPATAFHRLPSWGQAISPSAQSARWLPRALARTARWRPPTKRRRARASPTGQRLPQDLSRVRTGRSSTSTFSLDLFTISSAGRCSSFCTIYV